jgi:FKBP-type peptidyl-prolyl cis-trans isomerase
MFSRFFLLPVFLFAIISCRDGSGNKTPGYRPGKNDMADINRYIIQKDRERIQSYSERKGINIEESPTGLWFKVEKAGDGDFFKDNDRIVFEYDCSLLDGTGCYSSAELGPMEIILGRSELPAGLNEGLKLLKPGGAAIFIIPPFLAYGLIGDGKRIPPRATLVYNIRIMSKDVYLRKLLQ